MSRFLTIIRAHAAGTLADEPGCERFDVLTPSDGGNRVHLHEVYADEAAFTLHRASKRLSDVRETYQDLIDGRSLDICDFQDV